MKPLQPLSALVVDIETRTASGLAETLGIQEHQLELEGLEDAEDILAFADQHEIACGNASKPDTLKRVVAEKLQKLVDKASVKTYGAEVYAIACGALNGGPIKAMAVTEDLDEKAMIEKFLGLLETNAPHLMVGFHIRGFDIPVLRTRCMILGIHWPDWLPRSVKDDKYNENVLFDIRDVLDEGPLDTWLRVFKLPPKTAHGSQVQDMTPREVALYCSDDVERERLLAQRVIPYSKHREMME